MSSANSMTLYLKGVDWDVLAGARRVKASVGSPNSLVTGVVVQSDPSLKSEFGLRQLCTKFLVGTSPSGESCLYTASSVHAIMSYTVEADLHADGSSRDHD
jgi:hypothetical protein